MCTMAITRGGVTMQKAWFFFDGIMLALGAGITAETDIPVSTCVNQTLLNGEVSVKTTDGFEPLFGSKTFAGPAVLWHNEIGYWFPESCEISCFAGKRDGSWRLIRGVGSDAPITRDIVHLKILHGKKPANTTYTYGVAPNIAREALLGFANSPPLRKIAATEEVLAAEYGAKALAAAFYRPEKIEGFSGTRIAVDTPCLIMYSKTGSTRVLAVSNPENKPKTVCVRINRKLSGRLAAFDASRGETVVTVSLPDGEYAGQSAVVSLAE
jgi:chondroitin AC lyase